MKWICSLLIIAGVTSLFTSQPHIPVDKYRSLFLLGYGNIGQAVAKCEQLPHFSHIFASTRCDQRQTVVSTLWNLTLVPIADLDLLKSSLATCSHVLITIPPDMSLSSSHATSFYNHAVLDSNISKFIPSSAWVGFVSTTGVYGDHGPDVWVDETSQTLSLGKKNKAAAYLDLEQRLSWERKGSCLRIFRCAGIYGQRFSALHTILKSGIRNQNVHIDPTTKTSRIHEDDVARAIVLSMYEDIEDCQIYNLADDEPASREEVFLHASKLLIGHGWDISGANDTANPLSERHGRRQQEKKMVSNEKMKEKLLVNSNGLLYPTYRQGLFSICRSMHRYGK